MSIVQEIKKYISSVSQRALGIDAVRFNTQVALERLERIYQIESKLAGLEARSATTEATTARIQDELKSTTARIQEWAEAQSGDIHELKSTTARIQEWAEAQSGNVHELKSTTARIYDELTNLKLLLTWDLQALQRSDLFDEEFYCESYPEVIATGMSPIEHYLRVGALEGRRPNPLFDSAFYLATNSEVAKAVINPAVHYFLCGASAGCDPSPEFDTSFYLETNPGIAPSGLNPLVHYLRYGVREGRSPVPADNRYARDLHKLASLAAPGQDQRRLS
jgi:hypothetical protein